MESLALLVAIIVLGIIILGIISLFAVFRTPKNSFARFFFTVMHCAAIFAGGWLMLLRVGVGARLIGLLVFAAGCIGLLRLFKNDQHP